MNALSQRLAIAAAALAALAISALSYVDERRARLPAEAAIAKYGLDQRRPAEVEALRFQPAADLRASFLADMTLADVYSPVSLSKFSAEERGRWLLSLTTLDQQLAAARDLTLDALSRRPGWAYHHGYLGEIEYAALRRQSLPHAAEGSRRWEIPLLNGISSAPGNLTFPTYLGGAYIETWGGIEPAGDPEEVLGRAMSSPAFLARNYRIVCLILGGAEAMALLPDNPRALRVAFAREARDGDVAAAATLRARIDRAERAGRAADLETLRERARLRDVWGQRTAASQWAARYHPKNLDDETGRAEVAETLSLWPATRRGSWLRDPRASLVRHFLSGREADVDGATLVSVVSHLSDVPAPVRARVLALAGRAWEADQLFRESGTQVSFEWTPMLVDLARAYLEQGKGDQAAATLARVASSAQTECNVLLLRRRLEGEDGEAARALDAIARQGLQGSRGRSLSICVDPEAHGRATLVVSLAAASPALVSYGWDDGRLGSVVIDGAGEVNVPLSGMEGRHPFGIETEAGAKVEIVEARVEGES